jgi:hypothetical protein
MAAKLTRLTHKISMQLHVLAESCTICSSRFRRPVRKLLDTSLDRQYRPVYSHFISEFNIVCRIFDLRLESVTSTLRLESQPQRVLPTLERNPLCPSRSKSAADQDERWPAEIRIIIDSHLSDGMRFTFETQTTRVYPNVSGQVARLTHKIAIQLHLEAESCTLCTSRSRRPVRKLLDTLSYIT